MPKSILKKALLLGAVSGLAVLAFHAQKYVRLFLAMNAPEKPLSEKEAAEVDKNIDDMLRDEDVIRVKITPAQDDFKDTN